MRITPNERLLTWMQNCACIYSEMGACTPEYCGSVSYAETAPSPRVRERDRLVTKVRWERAQEVDPQDSPTTSAVVAASSDSSLSALACWSRPVKEENSLSFHSKPCFPLYGCIPVTQSSHLPFSMSTHVSGRLNQNTSCVSLIPRPDTPFSPGLPYASFWKSQSASICISCTVILRLLILKLQFSTSHIFSLFPGFMQVSLILACVGFVWGCSVT